MTLTLAALSLVMIAVINLVTMPLVRAGGRMRLYGWILLAALTIGGMGIYLWRGSPAVPSKLALFERAGPDFEKRSLFKKEIELATALATRAGDARIMLSLGAVRLQNGRIDQAISVLTAAQGRDPNIDEQVATKLGAAHYAAALAALLIDGEKEKAMAHFDRALKIAPADAPYRERLKADMKKAQDET